MFSDPRGGVTPTSPRACAIRTSAILAAAILAGVAGLQLALAVGVPWGGVAWGGIEGGQLSARLRGASAVGAVVLSWFALVLLTRGGLLPKSKLVPARQLAAVSWTIAGLMALNTLGNLASGNPFEQLVFAPITALLTMLAAYLAMRGVAAGTQ